MPKVPSWMSDGCRTYFNDNNPFIVAWLKELWPEGVVDGNDIKSLSLEWIGRFSRCHFFAGIGGWEHALDLAGWPRDRPVWTGSCPCQPFSVAGRRKGAADARHIWPDWLRLIRECHPPTVFGEQVSGTGGLEWLAGVRSDLEAEGYAVGCADLPACSAGAPHKRNRLFFVADADGRFPGDGDLQRSGQHGQRAEDGGTDAVAHPKRSGRRLDQPERGQEGRTAYWRAGAGIGSVVNAARPERRSLMRDDAKGQQDATATEQPGNGNPWRDSIIIHCRDSKARRISPEPGVFPLAARIPSRVGMLRGAGNSIVPQVAAAFIRAFLDTEAERSHQEVI